MRANRMVVVSLVAAATAFITAGYASRPFVYHVRPGFNEGTPITAIVFLLVFGVVFGAVYLAGHLVVNRYGRTAKKN